MGWRAGCIGLFVVILAIGAISTLASECGGGGSDPPVVYYTTPFPTQSQPMPTPIVTPITSSRAQIYVDKILVLAEETYTVVPFACRRAYQTRPDRPEWDTWQGGCVGHYKSREASAYASIIVWAEIHEGKLHPIVDFHSFVYSGDVGIMQHCSISSIHDDFLDNCTQRGMPTQTGLMIVDSEGVSVGLVEPDFDILEELLKD